jgi:hypothetical protein
MGRNNHGNKRYFLYSVQEVRPLRELSDLRPATKLTLVVQSDGNTITVEQDFMVVAKPQSRRGRNVASVRGIVSFRGTSEVPAWLWQRDDGKLTLGVSRRDWERLKVE